jgi:tyrosyl-tRNA synthetase
VEFVYNGDWLRNLGFQEISELAESFSVQQMLARRNFKDRIDAGQEISLREFLYPLMQGYDSVAVNADIEIGGFDQLFNLKAGRAIQKHYGKQEQNVLTIQMLEGTDGRKMSTSWGNIITIVDTPFDMYGKVMSVKDELIIKYYTLCTDIDLEEIEVIEKNLESGVNPRDIKMALARELVTMYHGEKEAKLAEDQFVETFQKGGVPVDAIEIRFDGTVPLVDLLLDAKVIESKTEWRRLVEEGAVKHESGEKIDEVLFAPTESEVIRVGKRRFAKIKYLAK